MSWQDGLRPCDDTVREFERVGATNNCPDWPMPLSRSAESCLLRPNAPCEGLPCAVLRFGAGSQPMIANQLQGTTDIDFQEN